MISWLFFVLSGKFPVVCSHTFMHHFSFSLCPCRWHMVESCTTARRQQKLSAVAYWALWDCSQWCWCHPFQDSDETLHKGISLIFFRPGLPFKKKMQIVLVMTVFNEDESRPLNSEDYNNKHRPYKAVLYTWHQSGWTD